MSSSADEYTIADQPARFARAKQEQNERYLDITTVYNPSFLKDKRVAVTGANRGIGLALATELTTVGAQVVALVRKTSPELDALQPAEIISGVDVTNDAKCKQLGELIQGGPVDVVCLCESRSEFSVLTSTFDSSSTMPDTSW